MARVGRREWLAGVLRVGALACLGGCDHPEVMAPPDQRVAESTKTPPPPGMKPQENFDPRKRLREKGPG